MGTFLYSSIADSFELLIRNGALKPGDKLPSLRMLSKQKGVSLTTVYLAMIELERKGLIESRPKSGYYVLFNPAKAKLVSSNQLPETDLSVQDIDEIVWLVYGRSERFKVQLSLNMPSSELLPVTKFKRSVLNVVRTKSEGTIAYGPVAGIPNLRDQIARESFRSGIQISGEEVIVTAGCLEAINLAVRACTQPGDRIVIESPTYFGIFQSIISLGRIPVEIPADPVTGVSVQAVREAMLEHAASACLFVTSFSNPLGALIPNENKKALTELMAELNTVLIENDIYGEMYFGKERPRTCKSYDKNGNVILCSSFSKSLAPGYRIGWILPGKYYAAVFKTKINQTVTTSTITQEIIADFLDKGRFDLHLKRLRKNLHIQSLRFLKAVNDYFPAGTRVTQPSGGFVLWVEFPKEVNTLQLFNEAIKQGIGIAPGQMFSIARDYSNFLRISIGQPYTDEIDKALKKLGSLSARLAYLNLPEDRKL